MWILFLDTKAPRYLTVRAVTKPDSVVPGGAHQPAGSIPPRLQGNGPGEGNSFTGQRTTDLCDVYLHLAADLLTDPV